MQNKTYGKNQIVVHTYQQTGSSHLQLGVPCQDVMLIEETETLSLYALADGQSGKQFSREGAAEALRVAADYLCGIGIAGMEKAEYRDEIQSGILTKIRKKLKVLAESKNSSVKEFASTLMVLAIDRESGRYAAIHLGDGCMIGVHKKKEADPFTMISASEPGNPLRHTWLTTSSYALSHVQLHFGNVSSYRRIALLTDGATAICAGRNIPRVARSLLQQGSAEALCEEIRYSNPKDDASLILLEIESEAVPA